MNRTKSIPKTKIAIAAILALIAFVLIIAQMNVNARRSLELERLYTIINELDGSLMRAATYRSPTADIDKGRQYLVGAGIWLPLNEATEDIVFDGGFNKDGSYGISISDARTARIPLRGAQESCRSMVGITSGKEAAQFDNLAGTIKINNTQLYILKNDSRACNGLFSNEDLDALVDAVKQAQVYETNFEDRLKEDT